MAFTLFPKVDSETFLFPQPTMDALREAFTQASVDPALLELLVQNAVAREDSSGGSIHLGEGPPPALIVGAKVGDVYIDMTNKNFYKLEAGA